MSKVRCDCGHVIVDQTDFLPYKAAMLADEDAERFWCEMSEGLAELVATVREGRGAEKWLSRHFGADYPRDLSDESFIADFQTRFNVRYMRTLYQCEHCGRLLVEDPERKNSYRAFLPEDRFAPGSLVTRARR